jgi:hypothetical protein
MPTLRLPQTADVYLQLHLLFASIAVSMLPQEKEAEQKPPNESPYSDWEWIEVEDGEEVPYNKVWFTN